MIFNKIKSYFIQFIILKEGEIIWLIFLIRSGYKFKVFEFNIKIQLVLIKFFFFQFKEEIKLKVIFFVFDIYLKKDIMMYIFERVIIIKSYCFCIKLIFLYFFCYRGWVWRGV